MSWSDAAVFCTKLSERERKAGRLPDGYEYRLPTEAEWEYAARGGAESKGSTHAGSNSVDEVSWYQDNSGGRPHPAGVKKPNELGLYDMSGNASEWCLDGYDSGYYSGSPSIDPASMQAAAGRVVRGGCWFSVAVQVPSVRRDWARPDITKSFVGFRACLAPPAAGK